jgi:hypothetical protein
MLSTVDDLPMWADASSDEGDGVDGRCRAVHASESEPIPCRMVCATVALFVASSARHVDVEFTVVQVAPQRAVRFPGFARCDPHGVTSTNVHHAFHTVSR